MSSRRSLRILCYGHDLALLQTRQWILRNAGFRVWIAEDYADVEQIIDRQQIELIILCHSLSDRSEPGDYLVELVRRLHARRPKLKVLALSLGSPRSQAGIADEVQDVLEGPLCFVTTVNRMLDHHLVPLESPHDSTMR